MRTFNPAGRRAMPEWRIVLCLLLIVYLQPIPTHGQPIHRQTAMPGWMQQEVMKWCQIYNVDPALPAAVMRMESGPHYQCGPLGRKGIYLGPGGVRYDYSGPLNIFNPCENIRVVVMSFRGCITEAAIVRRLKKYNTRWWEKNYLQDVLACYRQNKRRMIFVRIM